MPYPKLRFRAWPDKVHGIVGIFPHVDDEDFAVSYDAYFSVVMYEGKDRRSKKREAELMEKLRGTVDSITNATGGKID